MEVGFGSLYIYIHMYTLSYPKRLFQGGINDVYNGCSFHFIKNRTSFCLSTCYFTYVLGSHGPGTSTHLAMKRLEPLAQHWSFESGLVGLFGPHCLTINLIPTFRLHLAIFKTGISIAWYYWSSCSMGQAFFFSENKNIIFYIFHVNN